MTARIMGLDFGTKRIGIAMSDELLLTAQGQEVLERRGLSADMRAIRDMVLKYGVSEIVVGLPLNMNGTRSAKTEETAAFVESLSGSVGVPVRTYDERLTTMQAERALLEADMSRYKRKGLRDKIAAQLILQAYLDFRRKKASDG